MANQCYLILLKIHSFLFLVFTLNSYSCDFITPRTFIIGNPDKTERQKQNPWFEYIKSSLNYSIVSCFELKTMKHFPSFWGCLMKCSPSCITIKELINNRCRTTIGHIEGPLPLNPMLSTNLGLPTPELDRFMPQETSILGSILISSKHCSIFKTLPDFSQLRKVMYTFKTDLILRINITFTKFELKENEWVELLYRAKCKQVNNNIITFLNVGNNLNENCFQVYAINIHLKLKRVRELVGIEILM